MFLLIAALPPRPAPKRRNRPLEEVEQEQRKRTRGFRLGGLPALPSRRYVYLSAALGLLLIVGAASALLRQMPLRQVAFHIETQGGELLLNEEDLRLLLQGEEGPALEGQPMRDIQVQPLEQALLEARSIRQAEVYKSMQGVLHVSVELRKPVARLINNSGVSLYLDEDAVKFPVSSHASAHVPLIRGDFEEAAVDTFACNTISAAIPVLNYVQQDPFWEAQIAEVIIDQAGKLTLIPQVGETRIEFGQPVEIEEKFGRLLDFYRQVLPETGWNAYRSVSAEFRGQIVARRRKGS